MMNPRSIELLESVAPVEDCKAAVSPDGWVEVLVDCPGVQDLYTYRSPISLGIQPGDILSVPFGAQHVGAIAIRWNVTCPAELEPEQVRSVEAVVSRGFFPETYWVLLHQVADYYHTSLMQVIRVALPPGLLARSQRRLRLLGDGQDQQFQTLSPTAQKLFHLLQQSKTGDYAWKFLQQKIKGLNRAAQELIARGLAQSYLQPPEVVRPKQQQAVILVQDLSQAPGETLSDRQRQILDWLKRRGGEAWVAELLQACKTSPSVLKTLEKKGYVTLQAREVLRQECHAVGADQPKFLTPAQARALKVIKAHTGAAQVLLHGVTGSGKTEVYLQAIAPLLAQGKSALVLVPEIGLTPQLTDRFRARFGDRVCVYHSALSDGERYDTWRQMLSGEPRVVIGTRSAVFAPLPHLGLIVLDEEHDSSFKQDQPMPCYHARTVAQWRSQLEHCPLVLGSATPSLESWTTCKLQKLPMPPVRLGEPRSDSLQDAAQPSQTAPIVAYAELPNRVQNRPLPTISVVDMRQELEQGNRSMFSRSLQEALKTLQANHQQGILFIHRRGHSTHVSCRSCGYVMNCPHCDVSLAYHHTHSEAIELLRCHYCGFTQRQPAHCPDCDSPYFKQFGSGTQKVTQELAKLFPDLRVIRFDSDTTRTKGAHRRLLTQFAQGEADLLVGTQMLTKGIDLPQVTLVGIIAADGLLHLQDFRASERAFQTLLQVAGRAGRGKDPGRVILQTYTPGHPVVDAVVRHDYAEFVQSELGMRELLQYPPIGRLILLRFSGPDQEAVEEAAERVAESLQAPSPAAKVTYEILGPSPATIERIAQRYRWQVVMKFAASDQPDLPELAELRSLCGQDVSLTIDVDPMNFL